MKQNVFASSLVAATSSFTFGLFLTSVGLYLPIVERECKNNDLESYKNVLISLFCNIVFLGAFFSSYFIYIFSGFSKRNLLIFNNLFYFIASFLLLQYTHLYLGIISRFIIGIGAGISCCTVPGYIFMISDESNRGFYMFFNSVGIVGGLIFGKVLHEFCGHTMYVKVFAAILFYLVVHTMALFMAPNVKPKQEDAEKKQGTVMDLIRDPASCRSVVLTIAFHVAQHACGIDYFSIFMDKIFSDDGNQGKKSNGCLSFSALVNIVSANYIDKLGRKPIILISSSIIMISTTLMGKGIINIYTTLLYVFGFNVGLSSIPWFISNEVFPYQYSDAGQRLSVGINWLSAFFLSFFLTPAHAQYGNPVFFLYSLSMMAFIVIVVLLFKETKGKKEIGFQ